MKNSDASVNRISSLLQSERISGLRAKLFDEERYTSIEQAHIVTEVYKQNPGLPVNKLRAKALKAALLGMEIRIDPGELIVGNRTAGIRGGVIFPESGLSWVDNEIDNLKSRPQDKFSVHPEDIEEFRKEILPFWKGRTLEDVLDERIGDEMRSIGKVAKINQTDHAQGHICPDTELWLKEGPSGILENAKAFKSRASGEQVYFYEGIILAMEGAIAFMNRYAALARSLKDAPGYNAEEMQEVARICTKLASEPPESFHEAVQSAWFLYVLLHMESNASSFSPGRMDQFLYPFYENDKKAGKLSIEQAHELIQCLFIKFNHIVYLRSSNSARYFAGFPIGFNVAIGGQNVQGTDAVNELSYIFLRAQEHLCLPQPNLSARVYKDLPEYFLFRCSQVIGKGSGMPQLFNDEAVIPALINRGISRTDALNYAIVGCVELTTMGNSLGWSDAAMFNMVKALELALNDGVCLLSGKQMGAKTGTLADFKTYEDVEAALMAQIDFFFSRMISCCEIVEKAHAELLPSPLLSSVIQGCMEKGLDVTAGGAIYNLSGIQAIQCANIADSLSALKELVFEQKQFSPQAVHAALVNDFKGEELMRLALLNKAPKYGNDVEWVDSIANKWIRIFSEKLETYTNVRGGIYHAGLYTVSAHVPMGQNVGATPDGRNSREPLADGGLSAVYGRDMKGPTALLKSVSKINSSFGSNGTLLNMKFLPDLFTHESGFKKFVSLIRAFVELKIIHVQFNVVRLEDLLNAQENPEQYRSLTIRVAGYTAYFTELALDLQNEIIKRTSYTGL